MSHLLFPAVFALLQKNLCKSTKHELFLVFALRHLAHVFPGHFKPTALCVPLSSPRGVLPHCHTSHARGPGLPPASSSADRHYTHSLPVLTGLLRNTCVRAPGVRNSDHFESQSPRFSSE